VREECDQMDGGTIVKLDILADPERLARLDLELLRNRTGNHPGGDTGPNEWDANC
jgi:hypothetical protein